jgi:predicted transposase YbfD/YdcC
VFTMNASTVTVIPCGQDLPVTINLGALYCQFQRVPDQRSARGVRYPLAMLLTVAVLAKLSGASQVRALADWARERAVELAQWFGLSRASMPHPSTWSRILGHAVLAETVEDALQGLLLPPSTPEVPERGSQQLALDGKTLRGTIARGSRQGVHLLSAYQVELGITLRQVAVGTKENEIVAAPRLLNELELEGVVVSGDAMFAQRALSCQIREAGGDYCWIVKDNQPTLLDDLKLLFSPALPVAAGWSPIPLDFTTAQTVEKQHGRIDERYLTTSSLLTDYTDWPYLAQAFQVVRITRRGQQLSREERYGITSLPPTSASAARLLQLVRGHWRIENGLHYRRDVTLHEDASQVRMGQAPQVLATLNNLVCGLAARAGAVNLAALQRSLAAAFDRLLFRQ